MTLEKSIEAHISYYVGIDPGATGALAVISDFSEEVYPFKDTTEQELADIIVKACSRENTTVFLEKVASMPGNAANAMFTFGRGYGFLRGVMVANKIAFFDVPPQTWQNTLKLKTEKTKKEHLTEAELKIVQQCLDAAADGKFFEDWEFHTLFGVDRE